MGVSVFWRGRIRDLILSSRISDIKLKSYLWQDVLEESTGFSFGGHLGLFLVGQTQHSIVFGSVSLADFQFSSLTPSRSVDFSRLRRKCLECFQSASTA